MTSLKDSLLLGNPLNFRFSFSFQKIKKNKDLITDSNFTNHSAVHIFFRYIGSFIILALSDFIHYVGAFVQYQKLIWKKETEPFLSVRYGK